MIFKWCATGVFGTGNQSFGVVEVEPWEQIKLVGAGIRRKGRALEGPWFLTVG